MGTKINKLIAGTALCSVLAVNSANAAELDTNMAQMQAMDKITGRVSVVNVPVNGEVKFGSFSVVVRACKTRPPEETPENFAFVDVVDTYKSENPVNIFRGWMISSSPALNAVEHPIYDIWLLKCVNGNVDKTKLLSAEALKEREQIAQAEKTEEKDAPQSETADNTSVLATESEVEIPDGNVVEIPEQAEQEVVKQQSDNKSDTEAAKVEVFAEEGAPKSLLNIKTDEAVEDKAPALLPANSEEKKAAGPSANGEISQAENADDLIALPQPDVTENETAAESPTIESQDIKTLPTDEQASEEAEKAENVIPSEGQLIDFSADEIPEDEFEINAEALAD